MAKSVHIHTKQSLIENRFRSASLGAEAKPLRSGFFADNADPLFYEALQSGAALGAQTRKSQQNQPPSTPKNFCSWHSYRSVPRTGAVKSSKVLDLCTSAPKTTLLTEVIEIIVKLRS